jgi:3-hydroxymyristoyl/3-hydroxydecanoyl-(acyl carrier protein) dehydratase
MTARSNTDAPRATLADLLATCLVARPDAGERRFRFVAVVPPGHPVFDGHFPQVAILPGAAELLLVEIAAARSIGEPLRLAAVAGAKFSRPIFPGDEVAIDGGWSGGEDGRYAVTADLVCEGERAASMKLVLARRAEP